MRIGAAVVLGVVIAGPVMAQNIGDIGRALQEQVLPRQNPGYAPNGGRDAYEQGRRDEGEQERRREEGDRGERRAEEHRRYEQGDRRRAEDGREAERREGERREGERRGADEERARAGRY